MSSLQFVEIEDSYDHKYIVHLNSSTLFMKNKEGLVNIRYRDSSPPEHTKMKYDEFRMKLIRSNQLI